MDTIQMCFLALNLVLDLACVWSQSTVHTCSSTMFYGETCGSQQLANMAEQMTQIQSVLSEVLVKVTDQSHVIEQQHMKIEELTRRLDGPVSTEGRSSCALCPKDYYGPNCTVHCIAQDDCQGHYKCHWADGSKVCLSGWGGEECDVFTGNDSCPVVMRHGEDLAGIASSLLNGDDPVPDSAFTASSYDTSNRKGRPEYARLDRAATWNTQGGWVAASTHGSQWVQVDLNMLSSVHGVVTQGVDSSAPPITMTSYYVGYHAQLGASADDIKIYSDTAGEPTVFQGTADTSSKTTHNFRFPFVARIIRITSRVFLNKPGLRFDVIGAPLGLSGNWLGEITCDGVTNVVQLPIEHNTEGFYHSKPFLFHFTKKTTGYKEELFGYLEILAPTTLTLPTKGSLQANGELEYAFNLELSQDQQGLIVTSSMCDTATLDRHIELGGPCLNKGKCITTGDMLTNWYCCCINGFQGNHCETSQTN
ncbi:unnamed protein product [Owenia fusiformis]|uniref:Delta-like protein n=1 Tax=Owenia fusiformis TaxID=6347 RepID=A0A8S4NL66_OWEFU|nr:unnamed protein product [Owenia fusiformis]